MRYDFLREPISEAEPCGPDLDEAFDDEYIQWTSEASGLVPERFFTPRMGGGLTVFDRGTVDYAEQERRILSLLARSRDLRLVVLDARFQLLAGSLEGFAEALQAAEILATTFWDSFHPLPFDGTDFVMRVNTLEALNDNALVIPALYAVPLISGRSQVTYRNHLVATGALTPYEGEDVMTRDIIDRMLSPPRESPDSEPVRKQITALRDAADACLVALAGIRQSFIDRAGHTNAPKFEIAQAAANSVTGLEPALKAIIDFLNVNLGESEVASSGEAAAGEAGTAEAPMSGMVASHAAAVAALDAVESYFRRMEPSSPAVILVHQARLLVGRPLTEAFETLLPGPSSQAAMHFDSGYKFSLDLSRMKAVTDDLLANAPVEAGESWSDGGDESAADAADDHWPDAAAEPAPADGSEDPPTDDSETTATDETADADAAAGAEASEPAEAPAAPPPAVAPPPGPAVFSVATRMEAGHLIGAVESFFRQVEPSSPIPLLLIRARSYFGKDFSAILTEMMPADPGY